MYKNVRDNKKKTVINAIQKQLLQMIVSIFGLI